MMIFYIIDGDITIVGDVGHDIGTIDDDSEDVAGIMMWLSAILSRHAHIQGSVNRTRGGVRRAKKSDK